MSQCPHHHFDPFGAEYLADPYPIYATLHADTPVFYDDTLGYWVLTRYDDIKAVLKDNESFSSRNSTDPFTPISDETKRIFQQGGYAMQRVLLNADAPTHTRIRRHVYAAFTPHRVATLEPRIRELCQTFIARLATHTDPVDIIGEMIYALPAQVIFLLIGMEHDEVPAIKSGSESRVLFTWGKPSATQQADLARDMVDFWQRAAAFVAKRAQNPQDDFTSDLIRLRNDDDTILSMGEITSVIFGLLLAGHETTTGLLGNAIYRLLEDPQRWRQLADDTSALPGIIEELLRFDTSVIAMRRYTTRAVTIANTTIPADANVLLLIGAANRDANHFSQSHHFDSLRTNNREHLSFGFGTHYCIGAPLARLEAKVVLHELVQHFPLARLVPNQSLDYLPNTSFRGPRRLLVSLNQPNTTRI
ncbi:MAG: cytochrome P450 [Chloroflexota bacterium]|jgi:cytochrome P450